MYVRIYSRIQNQIEQFEMKMYRSNDEHEMDSSGKQIKIK